jgi:Fe2+ or Zn2+ uptake regulation protein
MSDVIMEAIENLCDNKKRYVRAIEVCRELERTAGISVPTCYRMIHRLIESGEVNAVRIGRLLLIRCGKGDGE